MSTGCSGWFTGSVNDWPRQFTAPKLQRDAVTRKMKQDSANLQPKTRLAYRCEPLLGAKGELVASSDRGRGYAGDEGRFWCGTFDFQ